jgi:hypothetical protein
MRPPASTDSVNGCIAGNWFFAVKVHDLGSVGKDERVGQDQERLSTRTGHRGKCTLKIVRTPDFEELKPQAQSSGCDLVSSIWRALPGLAAFHKTATRETPGSVSLTRSSRFAASSGKRLADPVTFPPGRMRFAARPWPTGSESAMPTMGIVAVACFEAWVAGAATATMTSTLSRTSSAARSGSRSNLPSAKR